MSESTNLYDPTWSAWRAYKTLFARWYCYSGHAAAKRVLGESSSEIWAMSAYYQKRDVSLVAD